MDQYLVSYYVGISIVFLSHIYTLVAAKDMMVAHSVLNILAGFMIAYYFVQREQIFK